LLIHPALFVLTSIHLFFNDLGCAHLPTKASFAG
jgi:hypothetical protein